jgi:hypothetical protein
MAREGLVEGEEARSYWIPGSYAPTLFENHDSCLRLLKNKAFKKGSVVSANLLHGSERFILQNQEPVYTPCGSPEKGSTEGKVLSGCPDRVEFQEQYSLVVRISIICIGQGPEHRRGLISTTCPTKVFCPEILQVQLIKSVEKVRGYYKALLAKVQAPPAFADNAKLGFKRVSWKEITSVRPQLERPRAAVVHFLQSCKLTDRVLEKHPASAATPRVW